MKLEPPIRYYKNMSTAAHQIAAWKMSDDKFNVEFDLINKWPCWKCCGVGEMFEWTGVGSDYNEAYCGVCKGSGVISKKDFKSWYSEKIRQYKSQLLRYKQTKEQLKIIRKKLTRAEYDFITKYE